MTSLTAWYRSRGARPVRRRGPVAPPIFGGARGGRRAQARYRHELGLGDVVDPSTLPYGPARNYGIASVEQWRPLVEKLAGTLPVEFLLAWIAVESGGNACDKETSTGKDEVAIFQLMAPDNINVSGYTEAQLYPVPPCGQGRGVTVADLSDDQATAQVQSGINYVNWCRKYVQAKLDQFGYGWDESEMGYWILVKWVHIVPSYISKILQVGIDANGGTPPSSWAQMSDAVASAGFPANFVTNGNTVGQYGAGGGSVFGVFRDPVTLIAIGAFAIGAYFIWKKVG